MRAEINKDAHLNAIDADAFAAEFQPLKRGFNAAALRKEAANGIDAEYAKFAKMNIDMGL